MTENAEGSVVSYINKDIDWISVILPDKIFEKGQDSDQNKPNKIGSVAGGS